MKRKIKTDSVFFTLIVTLIFFFLLGAVSISTRIILKDRIAAFDLELYIWINAAAQLLLTLALIALSQKLGIHHSEDYHLSSIPKGLYMGLVCIIRGLVFFVVNLCGNIGYAHLPKPSYFLACVMMAFTTGFFEEVLCRGFGYNNLKRRYGDSWKGTKKSIIISSLIFGIAHLVNLSGYNLQAILDTTAQIITAIIIGVYFSLIYIQSKSMWAVVISHAVADGAIFLLYSILTTEAFQPEGADIITAGSIVVQSFIIPLVTMIPIMIAVWIKWRRLKNDTADVIIEP